MSLTRLPAISALRVYVLNPEDMVTPIVVAILALGGPIANDLVRVYMSALLLEADRMQDLTITTKTVPEPSPLGCAIVYGKSPQWHNTSVIFSWYSPANVLSTVQWSVL